MSELSKIGLLEHDVSACDKTSEASVQATVRLKASKAGCVLWRNNVGAFKSEQGTWVRYGLCNESAAINKRIKSSDLIGIKPIIITREMVGGVIGQFMAVEVKRPSWVFRESDKRAVAQKKFIEIVNNFGGCAKFSKGEL